jgi:hypothetical protein
VSVMPCTKHMSLAILKLLSELKSILLTCGPIKGDEVNFWQMDLVPAQVGELLLAAIAV